MSADVNSTPESSAPRLARQATAREFLAVVFRRKWIILGLFLITTATVATVAITTPTTYISSGRVLVKRGERFSLLRPDRQVIGEWEQDLGSEMQVMKSQAVVRRAHELAIEQAKHEKVQMQFDPKQIDLEVMGKSNVVAMGYTDLDPSVAQIGCKALMDAYVEYHRDKSLTDKPKRFFAEEIADLQSQIDKLMEQRRQYTEESGMAAPLVQTQSWLAQLTQLESRRGDLAADLASAQSVEATMRKMASDPDIDLPTFDGVSVFTNEGALTLLKQRVLDQQARIATLTETLRDDAQEVVAAKQTLGTLQGLLHKEVDQRVKLAAARVEALQAKVNALDEEIASIHQQLDAVPQSIKTTDALDAQLAGQRERLKDVTGKQDEALVTEDTITDVNVTVLAPASLATATNPLDVVRLALAPAFSLLVGIAIAFFIDGLDLTVRTANQAEEYLDLPVLASMGERRRRNG